LPIIIILSVAGVLVLLMLYRRPSPSPSRARTATPDSFSDDPPPTLEFCSDGRLADQSLALTARTMDDTGAASGDTARALRGRFSLQE
jgi:hypothetical protein